MKIVIDIPEEAYELLNNEGVDWLGAEHILNAVANGTPLPKGHGRLVDMSKVIVKLMKYYDGEKTIGQCLDEVHTIIEADGGDAE